MSDHEFKDWAKFVEEFDYTSFDWSLPFDLANENFDLSFPQIDTAAEPAPPEASEQAAEKDVGYACPTTTLSVSNSMQVDSGEACACLRCWKNSLPYYVRGPNLRCPLCSYDVSHRDYLLKHYKTHCKNDGKFHCKEQGCAITTKTWMDLQRHSSNAHCTKPEMTECPVPWCDYHGKGKGFRRYDKMVSHYRNMHGGNPPDTRKGGSALVYPSAPGPIRNRTLAPRPSATGTTTTPGSIAGGSTSSGSGYRI